MLLEELPHQAGGVDLGCGGTGEPVGEGLAAGPGVTAAGDGVENHVGGAIHILEATDGGAEEDLLRST